jgi:hypothetical protein
MTRLNPKYKEWIFLLFWFVACLAIGAATVHDYGMSIDEPNNQRYANDTWNAYPSLFGTLYEPEYNTSYDGHGPAFITLAGIFVKIMQRVFPNLFAPDLWHFSYFVTFLLSGLCLYWLAKHWFSSWTAWGILILFSTQPLLWGHAFMNPKDIPFMAFFIASIAAGFAMVDSLERQAATDNAAISGGSFIHNSWRSFPREVMKEFANPWVWLSGIILGLTTSLRILGPYAGVIVLLYGLWKSPRRILGIFPAYFIITIAICYLTWPYLWTDPIGRFLQSIDVASAYPWRGGILFEGEILSAKALPASYLPKMISIQFTEMAIILFITGIVLAFSKIWKRESFVPLVLLFIWFMIPFAAIILMGSVVYDGFRQILFLLPPLFLITGFAIEWIFTRIQNVTFRLVLIILLAVPGVYSIITLHPYEYVYYNSLTGGVQGAYKNYELDYWATSYREAALFLNETAKPNTHVAIFGPVDIAIYRTYARPDIKVNLWNVARKFRDTKDISYEYAVIVNRQNAVESICKNARTVKTVERNGAILMVVKEIPPGQKDCP